VPRAARLTVDAMLDECVMVEQELVQFSQELGLRVVDVLAVARGEDDLDTDKGVPIVESREGVHEPVGMLPVSASELEGADGGGVADVDELTMGDTTGPEWNMGSMLVMQRGLVAASWVAGRRREDEAVVVDLAPQALNHEGGEGFEVLKWTHRNICDMTAVKRKRQFEEGKNDRKTAMDVSEKEKRQPHLSRDSQESRDHCGSKRRRDKKKKEIVLRTRTV
jgi:hypothetical protein